MNIRQINWQLFLENIKSLLTEASEQLTSISDSPIIDSEILLLDVLNQTYENSSESKNKKYNRAYLRTWPDKILSDEQYNLFNQFLKQRLQSLPIAYIIGYQEFWSLEFMVNPSTLIPRPETELLVEQALSLIPQQSHYKVLDLGTGSGAIALSIASERPDCQVVALDYSEEALKIAHLNAQKLKIKNCQFIQASWLEAIKEASFDLIISNPPYIKEDDPLLEKSVIKYEPKSALIAAHGGLSDIQCIINTARAKMKKGAYLLIEHGYDQAESLKQLLQQKGYTSIQQIKDYNGITRVSMGQNTR